MWSRQAAVLALMAGTLHAQTLPQFNYLQGEVQVDGTSVNAAAPGAIRDGALILTGTGRAEIRLAPDVFLRIGEHSEARVRGAAVEVLAGSVVVDSTRDATWGKVTVTLPGSVTQTLSPGDFHFDASPERVHIFRGEAETLRREPPGPGARQETPDELLDVWSTNRRIAVYGALAGPSGTIPMIVAPGLLPLPVRPYRTGEPFYGPAPPAGAFHQVIGH